MKTKTYNTYKFDELPDDSKEKAIEKYRESEHEYGLEWLCDDLNEHIKVLLADNGITGEPKIYYSLGYCQGDGAMFYGDFEWNGYNVSISHSGHYYHYNSKVFELECLEECPQDCKCRKIETDNEFNDLYVTICRELEKYGYDLIESATSDEGITEALINNDYDLLLDGEINHISID